MSTVKFPPNVADEPDCRFCGLCGRRVQPFNAEGEGFGPCIEAADNVIDCEDVRRAIVQAHNIAKAMERPVHQEWQAFIDRLGIPAAIIAAWLEKDARATAIKDHLSRGRYGMEGGAVWLTALSDWMNEGDADEKLMALIDEMRSHLNPFESTGQPMNLLEIGGWYERLAKRAADIIGEVPDFETAD